MKRFFVILSAAPSIVCLILLGIFRFHLDSQAEWIALITGWISSTATIILGVVVFYQTENHKRRQEEDNKFYQEQADKNRQQDLMLRANPNATFTQLVDITYAQCPMTISKNQSYNRLSNIDFDNIHHFPEHLYMNLRFDVPQNNVLERVYIEKVDIKCYKGEFAGGNFEEVASYVLKNYSPNENVPNIKVKKQGCVDTVLSLLFDFGNEDDSKQEEIKALLDNKELKWAMSIYYTLSNSFKIQIKYITHLYFTLANCIVDDYGDFSYLILNPSSTTVQSSSISIDR